MPSKLPNKKPSCLACNDTHKDSKGGDCFPCSINRKIARTTTRTTRIEKPKLINVYRKVKTKKKIPKQ